MLQALDAELDAVAGVDAIYDAALRALRMQLAATPEQAQARRITERLALVLQAAVLLRAQSPNASAFIRSRLGAEHGMAFGTLPADVDFAAVLSRALP